MTSAEYSPMLNSLQQEQTNLDDELEVIRKDAIRLAAVVVNLSKKYKPFQERVRVLGHRALNTSQLSDPLALVVHWMVVIEVH
jgi:hypothetical protein